LSQCGQGVESVRTGWEGEEGSNFRDFVRTSFMNCFDKKLLFVLYSTILNELSYTH